MSSINGILNVSRSSLQSQTAVIRTLGDNIANVNTPGYSRRTANMISLASAGTGNSIAFGQGVSVDSVIRNVDGFIDASYRNRISAESDARLRQEMLLRAEAPFTLDAVAGNIGLRINEFFNSLDDLAANPADIPLRQAVLDNGQNLTDTIQLSSNVIHDLQQESNDRIGVLIDEVNQISTDIATLNVQIAASEGGEQQNLALRDQRSELLRKLSEKIEFTVLEEPSGAIQVNLEGGFGLVSATGSRDLEFITDPSFAPAGGYPPGMNGFGMGHITFDFGSAGSPSHLDLTRVLGAGGGEVGGLLKLRGVQTTADTTPYDAQGSLIDIGTRIEMIARDLLVRFNNEYLGPDEDSNAPGHQPSSGDLNGNIPTNNPFSLFTFAGATDANEPNGLVSHDNDLVPIGETSYAAIIQFAVTAPENFAAARDQDPANALSLQFQPGNNENVVALLGLRDASITWQTDYSIGSVQADATIEEFYNTAVSAIGSTSASAINSANLEQDRLVQMRELYLGVSGVSLDEEFAKLVNFQRAFQGSARMISIADQLLAEVVGILG